MAFEIPFYIFGLQRSGTNYLKVLMEWNFACRAKNHETLKCWKHTMEPPSEVSDKHVLLIHKNPYKWIESLALRNTVDWLHSQRKYPADDRNVPDHLLIGPKRLNVLNLAKTYRDFHENWIFNNQMPGLFVLPYERLLSSTDDVLAHIERGWEFPKLHTDMWRVPNRGTISQSMDYNEKREQYYLSEGLEAITKEQLAEINKILDQSFMSRMGYKHV